MLPCAASSLPPRLMPLWTGQPLAYPTVQKTGAAAEGTRAAHGPAVEIDGNAEGRGPTTKSRGRDVERTCPQLRRKQEHNFPARGVNPQTSWAMLAAPQRRPHEPSNRRRENSM